MFVFVTDKTNKPLMPTTPSRARRLIQSRQATPFWKKGLFCIRLNVDPSNIDLIAVDIDPGSKKEGITVKSQHEADAKGETGAVSTPQAK
jgi:hypothetical protein